MFTRTKFSASDMLFYSIKFVELYIYQWAMRWNPNVLGTFLQKLTDATEALLF